MSISRSRLAAAAFEVLPGEAAVLDGDGMILVVNETWRRFGRENGAGAGCGAGVNYLHVCERAAAEGDDVAQVVGSALTAVMSGSAPQAALDYPCHTSTATRWFHLSARPMPGGHRVLVLHDEISRRVQEHAALRHQATHDPLTGLPNRVLLADRLTTALMTNDRRRRPAVTVLVADLDGFKGVNDEYGHLAGDAVLVVIADRLRTLARAGDTIARWGGDEFVLVLPDCPPDMSRQMTRRMVRAVTEPIELGQARIVVAVSIGRGVGITGEDPTEVLRRADESLRAEKANLPKRG